MDAAHYLGVTPWYVEEIVRSGAPGVEAVPSLYDSARRPRQILRPQASGIGEQRNMTEEFVTVKQVAERLHVARSTVYEWTRRRNTNPLPHYALSRKIILFRWSEVERWVEAKRKS